MMVSVVVCNLGVVMFNVCMNVLIGCVFVLIVMVSVCSCVGNLWFCLMRLL